MERRRITFTTTTVIIPKTCQREINEDYPASFTDEPRTYVGDESSCAPYSCPSGFTGPFGPSSSNECFCFSNITFAPFVIGGGLCPGGYYVCNGNRCCLNYTERVYFCPNGGSLSGTTCIKRRQEDYDCSYPSTTSVEDPVPVGYNRSPGTANVEGEWWRVTR
jgi:hypothetical protein